MGKRMRKKMPSLPRRCQCLQDGAFCPACPCLWWQGVCVRSHCGDQAVGRPVSFFLYSSCEGVVEPTRLQDQRLPLCEHACARYFPVCVSCNWQDDGNVQYMCHATQRRRCFTATASAHTAGICHVGWPCAP